MSITQKLLHTAVVAGLLAGAGPLAAQAPVVTSKGDPSVLADTIYKLAVDKPEYSEQATLLLLDDGIIRVEADGRTTRTYHQIVEILGESAIRGYQERSLAWAPGRQRLRVNWVKVLRPDGTVISDSASQVQDADVPAAMSDPVYLDQRVRRLSVSGVAVATIFDMSWTVEDTVAFPPNDYMGGWNVSMGSPVRRSRLILDVPASVTPRIAEDNLDFTRVERTANGRHVYVWARQNVPRVKPELMAADSNSVFMRVFFALPRTWSDVGRWYSRLSADRYELGPLAGERIGKVVAGARTRDDSVRALHKFVAQDIRYVSIALGRGGYQPRTPDEVVRTGFGDCKDKTTLFVATLNHWNIPTAVALLRTDKADRRLPAMSQFNHAIAAIEQPGGGYHYVDLTASLTPFDEIPRPLQGNFAIVLRQDGRVDEVTLPVAPMSDNVERTRITGVLDGDGVFDGHLEQTGSGLGQYLLRSVFATPFDSTQRVQFARAFASRFSPGMTGDSLVTFDGKDLRAAPRLSVHLHGAHAAQKSGTTMILSLGLQPTTGLATLADRLEEQSPRRFPIDASRVFGDMTRETEIRIRLPEGWHAQLPPSVHTKSVFGEYDSDYAQEGRDLVQRRRVLGARGVYAPERLPELTSWLRETAKDDARFIVLTTTP